MSDDEPPGTGKDQYGKEWPYEWMGEKHRKQKILLTPQVRALRERARKGMGPATSALTAQRVAHIAQLMRECKWDKKTYIQCMTEWMLSESRIAQLASEASRWTAAEVTDPKGVTETVADTLSKKLRDASELATIAVSRAKLAAKKESNKLSVMKDASMMLHAVDRLADTWTKVVGARAPEKHDYTMVIHQFDKLPPMQKLDWLDKKISQLQDAKEAVKLLMQNSDIPRPQIDENVIDAVDYTKERCNEAYIHQSKEEVLADLHKEQEEHVNGKHRNGKKGPFAE